MRELSSSSYFLLNLNLLFSKISYFSERFRVLFSLHFFDTGNLHLLIVIDLSLLNFFSNHRSTQIEKNPLDKKTLTNQQFRNLFSIEGFQTCKSKTPFRGKSEPKNLFSFRDWMRAIHWHSG